MENERKGFNKFIYNFFHTAKFKCFLFAMIMEVVLEMLGRRSFVAGIKFVVFSPIVYLYNVSIIFFTLLFAFFMKKRLFGVIFISLIWLICGIVNFVVLGYRVTPFAAIDVLMAKDVFTMIDVYLKKWQQVALLIGIVLLLAGMIFVFRKIPKISGELKVKRTMFMCICSWIIVWGFTNFGVKHNIISDNFANLGTAYKDYGFAYCFTNSIIDNGISEPSDYSASLMRNMKRQLDEVSLKATKRKPNIIVVQLESFFDINPVADLKLSSDPIPNFNRLKEEYPSGFFRVPALGAGTANTEFEVLTGIKSSCFGAGEYPYKTTVNKIPIESMCSLLGNEGYGTYAIHNNTGSFYDRKSVYDQMGFDAFIPMEYMYDLKRTYTDWAKDITLVDDIIKCMKDTPEQDFVFTISVQGHGRYPEIEGTCEDHIQVKYDKDPIMENQFHYYVNQIYEMDQMIDKLVKALDNTKEDYVLLLYGDHLPSLNLTEEQLASSKGDLFQTEYILVNNIGLRLEDKDIDACDISLVILKSLGLNLGYAQKANELYSDDEFDKNIEYIAYDMLFGNKYLYNGMVPVKAPHMKMGVDVIELNEIKNESGHVVVKGSNFNEYSVVFCEDEELKTTYVDRNTLMIENYEAIQGKRFSVKQLDGGHNIFGSTNDYIF